MQALLTLIVLPPAGPLVLALLGLLLRRRWLIGLGLALAALTSSVGVVDPLARLYAKARPAAETLRAAEHLRGREDALVLVLGGGIRHGAAADGGYALKPLTAERLNRGLWWSRRLQIPLAFTGGASYRALDPNAPSEADVVARTLAEAGLPPAKWLENQSRDTRQNAALSAQLVRQHGTRHLVLVTHALHMPRALQHFRTALPDVEIIPAPLSATPPSTGWQPSELLEWLPSSGGAATGHYLAYEWVARLAGH